MTLQNLLRIGKLKEHTATAEEVQRLLAAIDRSLADAAAGQISVQSLPLTLGVSNDVWVVLDALRRQRNANDYTGAPITEAAVAECLAQAKALRAMLQSHLASRHQALLKP